MSTTVSCKNYEPYHLYTRKILDRDRGKEIMCVRAVRINLEQVDPRLAVDTSMIGQHRHVAYVSDGAITCVGLGNTTIAAKYNKSHWVVLDEVPDAVKTIACDDLKLTIMADPDVENFQAQLAYTNAVSGKFQYPTCEWCGKQYGLKRCARCHTSHYCSIECQRNDWTTHKPTCKELSGKPSADAHAHTAIPDMAISHNFIRVSDGIGSLGQAWDR